MATESKFRYEVIPTQNGLQVAPTYDFVDVNDPDLVITETKEKEKFYYVKKIKNSLILINNDYSFIIGNFGKCYKYFVNIYKKCEGGEKFIIRAYFSDIDLQIDKDRCSIEVSLEVDSPYNCIKDNGSKVVNVLGPAPQNLFLEVSPTVYRSLGFLETILFINANMGCCDQFGCYVSVKSDFFNWVEDGGGGTIIVDDQALTNYVNPLQPNYYLRICAKSDIRNPTASNPATKLELSFNDIEKIMQDYFNCFWVIEYIGGYPYIRWEHYSWFLKNMNYDATTATNFPLNEYRNQISLDEIDIPSSEKWKVEEAIRVDFIGVPILYNPDCSNGEQKERGIQNCATDSDYIKDTPAAVANDGYLLVDCFKVNATPQWYVQSTVGQLSISAQRNGRLSIANLQYDLHRHGRPLIDGTMNNIFQTFLSKVPNIIQEDIKTELCCVDEFEKWKSFVRTEIGFGEIDEAEVDYKKEIITFKLRHDSI